MTAPGPRYETYRAFVLALVLSFGSATAAALDPTDPIDNLTIEMALGCNSTDIDNPQFYFWSGAVYGRRSGEKDLHLFNVQGVNPRACRFHYDESRGGRGYQAAARELMLYLDPVTNNVLDTWSNPYTGETVDVIQMVNDPASMSAPKFPLKEDGNPAPFRLNWRDMGTHLVADRVRPFFRDDPMGGDYQDYVGGKYQVLEMSGFFVAKRDVQAYKEGNMIPYVASWTRISPWLPWMKMGGREGMIVLSSQGRSTRSFDDLPEPLKSAIQNDFPLMRATPSFDDKRPFVTSWDSMKEVIDARRRSMQQTE